MTTEGKQAIDVEAYYAKYGPMVLRRCRFMLKDEEQARDAMHEVFYRLLTHQGRLRGTYPSGLLHRIATNICLNILRSKKHDLTNNSQDLLDSIAVYEEKEKSTIVRNLLEVIFQREKPSTREMAIMCYVDGMSYAQVAKEIGLSVSGVRKRLRLLKQSIKERGGMI